MYIIILFFVPNSPIKKMVVTNTIPLDMDKMPAKIKQLSVATIHTNT